MRPPSSVRSFEPSAAMALLHSFDEPHLAVGALVIHLSDFDQLPKHCPALPVLELRQRRARLRQVCWQRLSP